MDKRQLSVPLFWMPPTDLKGRPIDKCLLESGGRAWPNAFWQVEAELGDTSVAAEIFESAMYSVSNVLHRNGNRNTIHNLDPYLSWAFTRKLAKHILRHRFLVFLDAPEELSLQEMPGHYGQAAQIERKLLIKQLVSFMDSRTRWMFLERVCGQTWASIAEDLGTTANAAEVMYQRGVRAVRDRVERRVSVKGMSITAAKGKQHGA